jgi:hypothetical protein
MMTPNSGRDLIEYTPQHSAFFQMNLRFLKKMSKKSPGGPPTLDDEDSV